MAIYKNLNNLRTYMNALKALDKAKECGYAVKIEKYYPTASDKQMKYIHFMISYLSWKFGNTFFDTLRTIQRNVAPFIFDSGDKDKQGNVIYKPLDLLNSAEASSVIRNVLDYASSREILIPEPTDKAGVDYCINELESANGWI